MRRGSRGGGSVKFPNLTDSPTVKEVQEVDCLQMAMQSLVTADSGCARRPLEEQLSPPSQSTVVPDVFSYVSTPPKEHCAAAPVAAKAAKAAARWKTRTAWETADAQVRVGRWRCNAENGNLSTKVGA